MKNFLYILLVAALLISCKAKKLRKQAYQLEQQGAFEQAANFYYQSLRVDSDNVEAVIGFKKNAQIVLDNLYEEFYSSFKNGNYKTAIYLYDEAAVLKDKGKRFGIKLHHLNNYNIYYKEALAMYLEEQYIRGKKYLSIENFKAAKEIFTEIVRFNELFKDAKHQLDIATYEPQYLKGIQYLENNANRKAYIQFGMILNKNNYKDVLELKNEALERATIKIAVVQPMKSTRINKQKNEFKRFLITKLNDIPSPFYKVIEVPNLNEKQNLETQLSLAKKAGAKAMFMININDVSFEKNVLKTVPYKAYAKLEKKYKDEFGKTQTSFIYVKTTTNQFSQSEKVTISLDYKLISTVDKSIMVSKVISDELNDKINYMTYNGNYQNLVEGSWKYQGKADATDKVKDLSYSNNKLHAYFNSRKTLKTSDELYNDLLQKVSKKINRPIAEYDPY